jgi:glutathione S-transferase
MVLKYKGLEFSTVDESAAEDWGRNRRAEIPILLHDDLVVLNSSDIVAYLDHAFPDRPVFPADPRGRAAARAWDPERGHGFDAALAEYERLERQLPMSGYDVLTLPKVTVSARADFVLNALGR